MEDRFTRQDDFVPRDKLAEVSPVVIGVGAVGRPLVIQLVSMGAKDISLIDHDTVEESNVVTQGYFTSDINSRKVYAALSVMHEFTNEVLTHRVADRKFQSSDLEGLSRPVVFACVDCIEVRAHIFRACGRYGVPLMVDARIAQEQIQVLTVTPDTRDAYHDTLFPASETHEGNCTARGTIYNGHIASGMMLHQFTRWLRDIKTDPRITYDLRGSTIHHG